MDLSAIVSDEAIPEPQPVPRTTPIPTVNSATYRAWLSLGVAALVVQVEAVADEEDLTVLDVLVLRAAGAGEGEPLRVTLPRHYECRTGLAAGAGDLFLLHVDAHATLDRRARAIPAVAPMGGALPILLRVESSAGPVGEPEFVVRFPWGDTGFATLLGEERT